MYTVSITSSGQVSIPAKVRRDLGLQGRKKVLLSVQQGKVMIELVVDFLSLGGTFKNTAKKSGDPRKAFEEYLAREGANDPT